MEFHEQDHELKRVHVLKGRTHIVERTQAWPSAKDSFAQCITGFSDRAKVQQMAGITRRPEVYEQLWSNSRNKHPYIQPWKWLISIGSLEPEIRCLKSCTSDLRGRFGASVAGNAKYLRGFVRSSIHIMYLYRYIDMRLLHIDMSYEQCTLYFSPLDMRIPWHPLFLTNSDSHLCMTSRWATFKSLLIHRYTLKIWKNYQ